MKKIYIFIFTIGVSFLSSCDQDFLEKYPYASIATEEAITNLKDAQVALNGVYSGFKPSAYYGRNFTNIPDLMTDEVLSTIGYTNLLGTYYKWEMTSGDSYIDDVWAQIYSVIARANNIINRIDDLEGDADTKNQIKGEALLARAIAHFDLVRSFAVTYNPSSASKDLGVPIMLKFETGKPGRNTVEEVYQQVIADATTAKGLMITQNVDDVYLTPAAADALLARVYLYMKNDQKAIEYANNVIDNYSYSLADMNNYGNLWLHDKGDEIIWKIAYTSNDNLLYGPGYHYYDKSQNPVNADYIPGNHLLSLYDQANDIRYTTFFATVVLDPTSNPVWQETVNVKYPTNPELVRAGNNMIKVFRLSEIYLIRAEAHANTNGGDHAAMNDLNELRRNRISGYVDENLTGNALKEAIARERLKELCFEGHRFFDLKRWGIGFTRTPKPNTNPIYNELTIQASNTRWLWPIPLDEIKANKNIKQNPGY